ncbi:MAG: TonB-dependent receptor [Thiotrichaceae bacterium]|nr:TonB-dependent receptor [Thiotrichaceae bacterium]
MKRSLLVILIANTMNTSWALSPVADKDDSLKQIIVTATHSEIDTTEAPNSVTVISRKDIEQKGGENIQDLIRGTTGITLSGIGSGGRKGLSLRGMLSQHTLILVDGKRIPASNDSFGPQTDYQYDWISTNNIEQIEIVRGPMSVLYGADALGGVINIITRKPSKQLQGDLKITEQSTNEDGSDNGEGRALDFNLSGGSDRVQVYLGGQKSRREALDSKLNPALSSIEGKEKQQLTLGLNWQATPQQQIKVNYVKGKEDRWYNTQTRRRQNYQSQYAIQRDQASLGWKGNVGKLNSALNLYQNTIDISNKATNGVSPTLPQQLKDTVIDGSISLPLGLKHIITTGFAHRKEKLVNAGLRDGESDAILKSLFLQDEVDLSDHLFLTLGARLDDHDVFGREVSPRASIVWNARDDLTLRSSYGHGFRAPNIKQSSGNYVFTLGRMRVTGNPNLKPETNDAFEVGLNYHKAKYSVDFAIFDNRIKDLIELTGPTSNRTYKNTSEARLKGAELSTKIALSKGLNLTTAYQYLDAKDDVGNRLSQRPRNTLASNMSWDKNSWRLNLGAEYVSRQMVTKRNISTNVPSYTLWNTSISKAMNKNLDLSLGIDNLTDIRLEDKSPAFLHEEYPRTVRLEVRGKF